MQRPALPAPLGFTKSSTPAARATAIGCAVLVASLGLWHQVLATAQPVTEDARFVAFGVFVAGLFAFAFLLGGRRG
jgi:hypothetical protein